MKIGVVVFILLGVLTFFTSRLSYATNDWTGNINFVYGSKSLDKEDWRPLESQSQSGLAVDFGKKNWPIHLAVAYVLSSDDDAFTMDINGDLWDTKIKGSTSELRLGVKKFWSPSFPIKSYIGGGISIINGKIKMMTVSINNGAYIGSDSQSDQGFGGYINGGIFWTIVDHFNLGVDLGYSKASIKIYDRA